jgi:hypothetical protein
MNMTKLFSREWLEARRAAADYEMPFAGSGDLATFEAELERASNAAQNAPGPAALATLVRVVCTQEGLDKKALADRVSLTEKDLDAVLAASDPPPMRVVSQLAHGLKLSPSKLATLAGLAQPREAANDSTMARFATLSDGMGALNDEQRKALQEFVEFMAKD